MKYEGRHKFRAFKKDANHAEIKLALVAAMLDPIDAADYGFPCDFIVPYLGRIYMLEVKDGSKPPSGKRLTKEEEDLSNTLRKNGCKLYVVESTEEALQIFHPKADESYVERFRAWK